MDFGDRKNCTNQKVFLLQIKEPFFLYYLIIRKDRQTR